MAYIPMTDAECADSTRINDARLLKRLNEIPYTSGIDAQGYRLKKATPNGLTADAISLREQADVLFRQIGDLQSVLFEPEPEGCATGQIPAMPETIEGNIRHSITTLTAAIRKIEAIRSKIGGR